MAIWKMTEGQTETSELDWPKVSYTCFVINELHMAPGLIPCDPCDNFKSHFPAIVLESELS